MDWVLEEIESVVARVWCASVDQAWDIGGAGLAVQT